MTDAQIEELKNALRGGIVTLRYKKTRKERGRTVKDENGAPQFEDEVFEATATLNAEILQLEKEEKEIAKHLSGDSSAEGQAAVDAADRRLRQRAHNPSLVGFYNLSKHDWRGVYKQGIVSFERV